MGEVEFLGNGKCLVQSPRGRDSVGLPVTGLHKSLVNLILPYRVRDVDDGLVPRLIVT